MARVTQKRPPTAHEERSSRSGGLGRWPRYERAVLGLREYWYPAVRSKDLKDRPYSVTLLGEKLVVFRDGGDVYVLEDRCAHRGVPLSAGRREFRCTVSCAYHGWTYSLKTGELVAALTDGPDSGIVGSVRVTTYPASEKYGIIWVFVGDGTPPRLEDELPDGIVQSTYAGIRVREFVGNWRIAMEGSVDPSHALYLHRDALITRSLDLPSNRGRHWPEVVDGRYFSYRTESPTPEADYPGLGRWPRKRLWQRIRLPKWLSRGEFNPSLAAYLPCAYQVSDLSITRPFTVCSWYVPIDESHYRWFQVLATDVTGLTRTWAMMKYYAWLRFAYQRDFLNQDAIMNELAHPFYAEEGGWDRERLFRPDSPIVGWRRFVNEQARAVQVESKSAARGK